MVGGNELSQGHHGSESRPSGCFEQYVFETELDSQGFSREDRGERRHPKMKLDWIRTATANDEAYIRTCHALGAVGEEGCGVA